VSVAQRMVATESDALPDACVAGSQPYGASRAAEAAGSVAYGAVPRAGSKSSTWVRRMLLPDGSRNEVSMP
jgi:hypothetical protein